MDLIFPKIKELATALLNNHFLTDKGDRFAFVKAGQRAGKSMIAYSMIDQWVEKSGINPVRNVIFIQKDGADAKLLRDLPEGITSAFYTPFDFSELTEDIPTDTLVVFDDALWVNGSYELVEDLRKYCQVLVVTSRGPEYDDDPRWRYTPGYSFNTWDLNPTVSLDFLAPHFRANNNQAERDFRAF